MKKLRLLLTENCHRNCIGCCNKDWDIKNLPICTSYKDYDEILITGGEPTLKKRLLIDTIHNIRYENPKAKIFVYTTNILSLCDEYIHWVDGITLTLHTKQDADMLELFERVNNTRLSSIFDNFIERHYNSRGYYTVYSSHKKSLRLNIFKGIRVPKLYNNWKIQKNMIWIKDCPLPKDEVFMKL